MQRNSRPRQYPQQSPHRPCFQCAVGSSTGRPPSTQQFMWALRAVASCYARTKCLGASWRAALAFGWCWQNVWPKGQESKGRQLYSKKGGDLKCGSLPGVPCMLVHVKIQDHPFLRAHQTPLDTWQRLVEKDMMWDNIWLCPAFASLCGWHATAPCYNLTVAWVVETLHYFWTARSVRIYIYIYI